MPPAIQRKRFKVWAIINGKPGIGVESYAKLEDARIKKREKFNDPAFLNVLLIDTKTKTVELEKGDSMDEFKPELDKKFPGWETGTITG